MNMIRIGFRPDATRPVDSARVKILTNQLKAYDSFWLSQTSVLAGWQEWAEATQGKPQADSWVTGVYWGWNLYRQSKEFDVVVTGTERAVFVFQLLQAALRWSGRTPHIIIYTHWNPGSSRLSCRIRSLLYRFMARYATKIVVYSEAQLGSYVELYGLSATKLVCVRYHTTCTYNCTAVDGDYVFAGGDYTRDYKTLVEAVRGLPYRVVIAARRREYFRNINVPANVTVLTTTPCEFIHLMAESHVVVVPLCGGLAHSGGQQTYLNAMALGKPVIVADDCGADEYIRDGLTGIVVPPGDPEALRRAIQSVFTDDEFARSLSENAREAATAFSPRRFHEQVLELARGCVSRAQT